MSKPRFFLVPVLGLGNRLLMITSALRVAELMNYDLVLVWTEGATYGGPRHFHGNFSAYFSSGIGETTYPLRGLDLYHPRPLGPSGFILDESTFSGSDVYVAEWTHNIFLASDLHLEKNALTTDYFRYLQRVITPSDATMNYITDNYTKDAGFNEHDYLGVHIRKGGIIGKDPPEYNRAHSINNSTIAISTLKVLRHLAKNSAFICGQDYADVEAVSALLRFFGVTVMVHRQESFPIPPGADHVNTSAHSAKAVADFVALQKSTHVLTSAMSTFGAFAAIRPSNVRFIMAANGGITTLPTTLGSGSGL